MDETSERVAGILRAAPLIDGHNDLLWELRDAPQRAGGGAAPTSPSGFRSSMTDLPRLADGRRRRAVLVRLRLRRTCRATKP